MPASFRLSLFTAFTLSAFPLVAMAQVAPGNRVPVPPASVGQVGAQAGGQVGGQAVLAQASPADIAQTNMRIERLEGELRQITGQMEQLMFQMRQLQDELTRSREDTEFRLRELEGNGGGLPMDGGGLSDDQLRNDLLARERGQGPRNLGTLSLDENGQPQGATLEGEIPLDLSSLTLNGADDVRPQQTLSGAVASIDPVASLPAGDIYDLGYDQVLRGDYGQAAQTFGDFIDLHPDHRLRPNAHFWLGESHFAMGAYTPAAEQFLAVFNAYPEDVKVPDALLKLAMSLDRLGAQGQACATFTKLLTDYPRAPQIVLDTARTEQGLAGC